MRERASHTQLADANLREVLAERRFILLPSFAIIIITSLVTSHLRRFFIWDFVSAAFFLCEGFYAWLERRECGWSSLLKLGRH